MGKIIKINERKLINYIKNILKEEDNNYYQISTQQYMDLLKRVNNVAHGIPMLPQFRGKRIVVNGNLDLSGRPITSLGNIKINGDLNINHTKIKSLDDVEVTGRKSYWGTPYEEVLRRIAKQKQYDDAEERRQEDVWNVRGTDDEGYMANAAFEYAIQQGLLNGLDDDEKEELKDLEERLSILKDRMDGEEDEETYDELSSEYDELEERSDELKSKQDIYDLVPSGRHYYLHNFESLSEGFTISVGTSDEADRSMRDYFQEWVDHPEHYLSTDHLEYHIDGDSVADDWEDTIREWVYDSPESYSIDRELSKSQEDDIWLLEMEKWVYENEGVRFPIKYPSKEDNGRIFDFMDENEEHEFQYRNESSDPSRSHWVLYKDGVVVSPHQLYDDEDTDDHQDDRESRISDIEYDIQEIKDNPDGDLDESSVEDYVENRKYEISRNPVDFLKDELGYDSKSIAQYVDSDSLLESLIDDSNYGDALNGYDGGYDEIKINGDYYVVMRTE